MAAARAAITQISAAEDSKQPEPDAPNLQAQPPQQQQQPQAAPEGKDRRISQNMTIPTKAVGAIIGPKGATVSRLRRESGCGIHVCSAEKSQDTTLVELDGLPEQVGKPPSGCCIAGLCVGKLYLLWGKERRSSGMPGQVELQLCRQRTATLTVEETCPGAKSRKVCLDLHLQYVPHSL